MPTEYLAGLSYRDRESKWTDILSAGRPVESNFVAETDGGEVVGFAGGGPEREGNPTFRGELYAIYLFEEYRRAGVGRRLVSAVARRLLVYGCRSMLVWVLEDNRPACAFYEPGSTSTGAMRRESLGHRMARRYLPSRRMALSGSSGEGPATRCPGR